MVYLENGVFTLSMCQKMVVFRRPEKMVAVSKNDRRQSVAVVSVSLCPCVPVGVSV